MVNSAAGIELTAKQTANNFVNGSIGARRDFGAGLILDGMRDIDGVKLRSAQRGGLRTGGCHKLRCGHRHGRRTLAFQFQRIVQTARGAGTSIGQTFDDGVHGPDLLQNAGGRWFGESRLYDAQNGGYLIALFQ